MELTFPACVQLEVEYHKPLRVSTTVICSTELLAVEGRKVGAPGLCSLDAHMLVPCHSTAPRCLVHPHVLDCPLTAVVLRLAFKVWMKATVRDTTSNEPYATGKSLFVTPRIKVDPRSAARYFSVSLQFSS